MKILKQYKPKGQFSEDTARDLLREMDLPGSVKNGKLVCFLVEAIFNDR